MSHQVPLKKILLAIFFLGQSLILILKKQLFWLVLSVFHLKKKLVRHVLLLVIFSGQPLTNISLFAEQTVTNTSYPVW